MSLILKRTGNVRARKTGRKKDKVFVTEVPVKLKKIGSEMGGRDHSTVLHGSKKISSELKTSEDMRKTIEILKKKINPS